MYTVIMRVKLNRIAMTTSGSPRSTNPSSTYSYGNNKPFSVKKIEKTEIVSPVPGA